jgi:predicted small integral membrane protein
MNLRHCKIVLTSISSLFFLLVFFTNATDPNSNYQFVRHVLGMDTTFPGNAAMYRAVRLPLVHKAFYASIIGWEGLCCALIGAGTLKMWRARAAGAAEWKAAKVLASVGLTAGMVLWYLAFLCVGGEWFLMWQSRIWNGQDAAARMFAVMGVSLLFLNQPDD